MDSVVTMLIVTRGPAKYICKVCGKLYLGDKKIAKHLKHFPSHEFAAPEPPPVQLVSPQRETKKNISSVNSFDSYIVDCEPNKFVDQVGAKLFKSFSLWDLMVKKTVSKKLNTAESLMSLFADMQAIVMELKNLVEQCLTSDRSSDDSVQVTLTPIMSSVLGLSQSPGVGVTRWVLPRTQVPHHYHSLLNFSDQVRSHVSSSTPETSLMSPESTSSVINMEEDSSQMSSDYVDQPLSEKVVLEDNLGARHNMDLDEDTQDSAITAPSPSPVSQRKRSRLDSESQSIISPPPRTPDFLSQGLTFNI